MDNTQKFFIDGRWVEPSGRRRLEVVNPATEQPIATIALGEAADIDRAVGAARRAFPAYSATSREERIALLERILALYKKRWHDIALSISTEVGAPIKLAEGSQTGAGFHHFSAALAVLKTFKFEEKLGNSQIVREPIGVCGLITPWNWPLNQIAAKVGPALACGCTMVLKPSEVTPSCALIVAEILQEAGVPPGVFNLVNGDGPVTGAALAAHPDVDFISFTGSTVGGVAVAHAAADSVKRVAQELGGKSPNVILDDADFEAAVARDVKTLMNNSGQSCNAPSRMLVPAARLEEAQRIAVKAAESIQVGDPASPDTAMGPVVSQRQWMRVQRLINAGIEEGAKALTGGPGRPAGLDTGYFVRPTIFTGVGRQSTIAREEIFGPVLVIMPYDSEDQAVEIANDTVYGLSAYVSSKNLAHANQVARRLRAGNVHINGQWGSEPTPFGGYKQSGNGREGGAFGFQDFLETKAILAYY
jgi:aldehyde dehydrogenase (NAD+)